jgi:hypothetical protein
MHVARVARVNLSGTFKFLKFLHKFINGKMSSQNEFLKKGMVGKGQIVTKTRLICQQKSVNWLNSADKVTNSSDYELVYSKTKWR